MLQTVTAESFGERLARRMRDVVRRMAAWSRYFRTPMLRLAPPGNPMFLR